MPWALFSHIQAYSEPCETLAYAETLDLWNDFWSPQLHEKNIGSTKNMILLPCIFDEAVLGSS